MKDEMHIAVERRKTKQKKRANEAKCLSLALDPSYKAKKKVLDGHALPLKWDLFPSSPGTEWSKLPIIIGAVTKALSYHTT